MNPPKTRVITYIDGLNLYHSIRKLNNPALKQCNVRRLIAALLSPEDDLQQTRYYTSHPTHCSPSHREQHSKYVVALEKNGVDIINGYFKRKNIRIIRENIRPIVLQNDFNCDKAYKYIQHEEKGSDVAVAVDLIADAYADKYDKAILLSADSDFMPAIMHILLMHTKKQILILLPPGHQAKKLRQLSEKYQPRLAVRAIKSKDIASCLLSNSLMTTPPN